MTDIKNVFISHVHKDDEGVEKLKRFIEDNSDLTIRDASITNENPNNASNPDYIKNKIIRPGIEWCGTLIVYITPKTKDSDWVEEEITMAENLGKRIVGVWAYGHANCELPKALEQMADAIVTWNSDKIVSVLKGESNVREDQQGNECPPSKHKHNKCP